MNTWQRFWIGGGGALLPLLVTLLALDLPSVIDHAGQYSMGTYVGTALRYILLFALGGAVAALNSDEQSPIKLVQLGIAAPALISSFVNAQTIPQSGPPKTVAITLESVIFTTAQAREAGNVSDDQTRLAGFLSDVVRGVIQPLPQVQSPLPPPQPPPPEITDLVSAARSSAAAAEAASRRAAETAAAAAASPSTNASQIAKEAALEASAASTQAAAAAEALNRALKAVHK